MNNEQPELFEIGDPYRSGENPLPEWNDERLAQLLDHWRTKYF